MPHEEIEKLTVYMDVAPPAQCSGVWLLTGYAVNCLIKADHHLDIMDVFKICGLLLLTACSGSGLLLHKAGVVIDLRCLDFLLFCSGSQTHFNED
jgi:hypothetical protein